MSDASLIPQNRPILPQDVATRTGIMTTALSSLGAPTSGVVTLGTCGPHGGVITNAQITVNATSTSQAAYLYRSPDFGATWQGPIASATVPAQTISASTGPGVASFNLGAVAISPTNQLPLCGDLDLQITTTPLLGLNGGTTAFTALCPTSLPATIAPGTIFTSIMNGVTNAANPTLKVNDFAGNGDASGIPILRSDTLTAPAAGALLPQNKYGFVREATAYVVVRSDYIGAGLEAALAGGITADIKTAGS